MLTLFKVVQLFFGQPLFYYLSLITIISSFSRSAGVVLAAPTPLLFTSISRKPAIIALTFFIG